jgi:WD40 repeat protein
MSRSTPGLVARTFLALLPLSGGAATAIADPPAATRPAAAAPDAELRRLDDRPGEVVWAVAFSPDGGRVAAAGGGTFRPAGPPGDFVNVGWAPGRDFAVRVWDVATGKPARSLVGHTAGVGAVAWSPDGARLASGSADGTLRVWDAATGAEVRRAVAHGGAPVWAVAFSPDGRRLATGGWDGTVRVWDAAAGGERLRVPWANGRRAWDVAWSPDGTRLAACGDDPVARVYDAATGRELLALDRHRNYVVRVAFSPDGRHLATGGWDDAARLWDAATGRELHALRHGGRVEGLAFTPDGRRLVTGSLDRAVRVWDAEAGAELAKFDGHDAPVARVAVAAGGRAAASASWDGTVRLWRVPGAYDPVVAWQVFPAAYRPPPKLADAVAREVEALGADDPRRREAAALTLRELGDEVVPLLRRLDPSTLSAEQRGRVAGLLRGRRRVPAAEAEALRADREFLLDCVAAGDAAVARAAVDRLRAVGAGGAAIDVDPDAPPAARAAAVARLRAAGGGTR